MHLKDKDHTINNTLFFCITTGILFILSLKRPFSNYETIILLIFVTRLPHCNAILLFRITCKTLDITYKMEDPSPTNSKQNITFKITEWSGTQNKIKYSHPINIFNLKAPSNFKLTIHSIYTS